METSPDYLLFYHPGQSVIVKLGWCRELGCTDEDCLAVVDEKNTQLAS
jgi:hypothetical protein